jgi:integrative and conjugative element protein (TIGR02256 family)
MPQVLVLAERAHGAIVADCLAHLGTEIGGLLPGRAVDDAFVVPFSIPAGPGAKKTPVRFSPDCGWQQVFLDFLFARFAVDYLGDWHRHPGHFDRPSAQDLRTARHIVNDPGWDVSQALFPIAVIDGAEVRIRAYLMRRESLEFEEIPLEIVPDTDPRMTAVLTGMDATKKESLHAEAGAVPAGGLRRRSAARRFVGRLAAGLRRLSRV